MTMPHIRIHNTTGVDLDAVVVYLPTATREAVDLGAVINGAFSAYQEVPTAYGVAEIHASGAAGSYSLRPYDYVGEQPMPEGKYTYRLGIAQGRLTLDVEASAPPDE